MLRMLWTGFLVWCVVGPNALPLVSTATNPGFLDVNVTDACLGCRNGGFCNESIAVCICQTGFQGKHCETIRVFNCSEVGCNSRGECLATGVCRCEVHYFGDRCEYKDAWFHHEVETHSEERSTIVSITSGMIVMVIICTTIICMNFKRTAQSSGVIAENSEELSDIVQVDGPPRLHNPFIGQERGNVCTTNWFSFQRSRPLYSSQMSGLHGVMTAPAVLQGNQQKKYTLIVSVDDESTGSVVTMPGDSQNSIPPPYEEAVDRYGDLRSGASYCAWQRHQSASGIFLPTAESSGDLNRLCGSRDNLNPNNQSFAKSGSMNSSVFDSSFENGDIGAFCPPPGCRSSVDSLRSNPSGILDLRRSATDDSLPFIDKDLSCQPSNNL